MSPTSYQTAPPRGVATIVAPGCRADPASSAALAGLQARVLRVRGRVVLDRLGARVVALGGVELLLAGVVLGRLLVAEVRLSWVVLGHVTALPRPHAPESPA